jgi:ammonia channel protein AmtB
LEQSNGDAAMAMLVTHISAATAAMVWMFYEWIKFGKPTALGTVTGMVAGLGTITPASGFVGPAGALIIGASNNYINNLKNDISNNCSISKSCNDTNKLHTKLRSNGHAFF